MENSENSYSEEFEMYDNNENNIISGSTVTLNDNSEQFKVNIDNVKNIDDIKLILKGLNLYFSPPTKEDYEEMKHLLTKVEW
tara:strand:+ start:251 stop:496 length:246 start_codon:yes stop_codon:yes gene_type:complete